MEGTYVDPRSKQAGSGAYFFRNLQIASSTAGSSCGVKSIPVISFSRRGDSLQEFFGLVIFYCFNLEVTEFNLFSALYWRPAHFRFRDLHYFSHLRSYLLHSKMVFLHSNFIWLAQIFVIREC